MNNLKLTPWINYDPDFNYAAFCVEITDNINYFTSTSSGDCWCTCSEDVTSDVDKSTVLKGNTYTVKISIHDNKFEITYTNKRTNEQLFNTLSLDDISNFSNPLYVQVLSQVGTLTITNDKNDSTEIITGTDWWAKSNKRSSKIEISDGDTIEFSIEVDNDNSCGFYEYECWYKGSNYHARNLEELQAVILEQFEKRREAVKIAKKTEGFIEKYNALSDEERRDMTLMKYYDKLNERELTDEELQELKEEYDWFDEKEFSVIDNPDITIQHFEPTGEDIQELRNLLHECPDLGIMDLEQLYFNHTLTNVSAKVHLSGVENAERLAEQYSSDLEVSELLCEMYEKMLELETQLVNTSEELVNLYESK